eukprot:UN28038
MDSNPQAQKHIDDQPSKTVQKPTVSPVVNQAEIKSEIPTIPRPRHNDAETAQNNTNVQTNKTINDTKVNNNNFTQSRTAQPGTYSRKLFVGNVPQSKTSDEFKEYFGTFGALKDVYLMRNPSSAGHRGFGFVHFEDVEVMNNV